MLGTTLGILDFQRVGYRVLGQDHTKLAGAWFLGY